MTCAEVQKVLPYIIETGGNAEEEEHLRECKVCSDLVQDLKYIAEQAKLLVPMEDPNPRVWEGIRAALEREGITRSARGARGRLLGSKSGPWVIGGMAVVIVLATALLSHRSALRANGDQSVSTPATSSSSSGLGVMAGDRELLSAIEGASPSLGQTYSQSLEQVNSSIAEARAAINRNPGDSVVREFLNRAYQQKAMLYELAMQSMQ